jgi:hypothetical protein
MKKAKPTKKVPAGQKPVLGIRVGKPTEILYAHVRAETKEWFRSQQEQSGASSLGQFMDLLCERLREMA